MEVQFAHDQLLKAALCPGNLRVQGSLFGVIVIDEKMQARPRMDIAHSTAQQEVN